MAVRRLVHALGFRYRLHVRGLPGNPDLVFRRLQKIIEVRGCFWHLHGCPRRRVPSSRQEYWIGKLTRNHARDKANLARLRRMGWKVLVLWECQIKPSRADWLRQRIERFLNEVIRRPKG